MTTFREPVSNHRLAARIGSLGFAAMAAGMVLRWSDDESDVFGLCWQELGLSELLGLRIESALLGLLAAGALGFLLQAISSRSLRTPTALAVLCVSAWTVSWTVASSLREPWHPEWIPFARAARWLGPIALFGLVFRSKIDRRLGVEATAWALSLTFIAHGAEACLGNPHFVDLVHALHRRLGIERLRDAEVESILVGIAISDWLVAAALLVFRRPRIRRRILIWMALWGTVTALSRVVQTGDQGISEALLRSSHLTLPLALAVVLAAQERGARGSDSVRA